MNGGDLALLTIPLTDDELGALLSIAPGTDPARIATGLLIEMLREMAEGDASRARQLVRWGGFDLPDAEAIIAGDTP